MKIDFMERSRQAATFIAARQAAVGRAAISRAAISRAVIDLCEDAITKSARLQDAEAPKATRARSGLLEQSARASTYCRNLIADLGCLLNVIRRVQR